MCSCLVFSHKLRHECKDSIHKGSEDSSIADLKTKTEKDYVHNSTKKGGGSSRYVRLSFVRSDYGLFYGCTQKICIVFPAWRQGNWEEQEKDGERGEGEIEVEE